MGVVSLDVAKEFDDYSREIRKFISRYREPEDPITMGKIESLDYPYISVYRCLAGYIEDAEFIHGWVHPRIYNIPESEFSYLNREFSKLTRRQYELALELRKQIAFSSLPEKEPDDLQKYFMKIDPYCKDLKKEFSKFIEILGSEEDYPERKPWEIPRFTPDGRPIDPYYISIKEKTKDYYGADFIDCMNKKVIILFRNAVNTLITKNKKWDEDTTFEVMGFARHVALPFPPEKPPTEFDPIPREHVPWGYATTCIGSVVARKMFEYMGASYEEYIQKIKGMFDFFETASRYSQVATFGREGEGLIEISQFKKLPPLYSKLIKAEGEAISSTLDVRAYYTFALKFYCLTTKKFDNFLINKDLSVCSIPECSCTFLRQDNLLWKKVRASGLACRFFLNTPSPSSVLSPPHDIYNAWLDEEFFEMTKKLSEEIPL